MENVAAMMTFTLSELVAQAEAGMTVIEPAYSVRRNDPNPPIIFWFRGNGKLSDHWFYMRLWLAVDGHEGYLTDVKCKYYVMRDVPLQKFYEKMREHYVWAKLTNDDFPTDYMYGASPHASRLDLVFNNMAPNIGYYELGARLMRLNEGRP